MAADMVSLLNCHNRFAPRYALMKSALLSNKQQVLRGVNMCVCVVCVCLGRLAAWIRCREEGGSMGVDVDIR